MLAQIFTTREKLIHLLLWNMVALLLAILCATSLCAQAPGTQYGGDTTVTVGGDTACHLDGSEKELIGDVPLSDKSFAVFGAHMNQAYTAKQTGQDTAPDYDDGSVSIHFIRQTAGTGLTIYEYADHVHYISRLAVQSIFHCLSGEHLWFTMHVRGERSTPAPTIAAVTPSVVMVGFPQVVQITGGNFETGASVSFNGSAITPTALTSNSLTVAIPRSQLQVVGVNSLKILNPDGGTSAPAAVAVRSTSSWQNLTTLDTAPSPRTDVTGPYILEHDFLLGIGGNTTGCTFTDSVSDVFKLDNATATGTPSRWTHLYPSGPTLPGRRGATAIYVPNSDSIIVYGGDPVGCSVPKFGDVWVLQHASTLAPTWKQLQPAGSVPPPRSDHGSFYVQHLNRLIIVGGYGPAGDLHDVWALDHADGTGGNPVWSKLTVNGTQPGATGLFSLVFNETTNRAILFGGWNCCSSSAAYSDVYLLVNADGSSGVPTWERVYPAGVSPAARFGHVASLDTASNTMTVFGGTTSSGQTAEVLVLQNADGTSSATTQWSSLQTSGSSTPLPTGGSVAQPAVFYNSDTHAMGIFGGGTPQGLTNAVFLLHNANGVANYGSVYVGTSGGRGTFSYSGEQAASGNASGRLGYDFTGAASGDIAFISSPLKGLPAEAPSAVVFSVYGDGSGNDLSIVLWDNSNERFAWDIGPVTWQGWRSFTASGPSSWPHYLGNHQAFEGPLTRFALDLSVSSGQPKAGAIFVDNVVAKFSNSQATLTDFEDYMNLP